MFYKKSNIGFMFQSLNLTEKISGSILGVANMGACSNKDSGDVYNCGVCKRQSVTSVLRMNIGFEAIDNTGSFMFISFTNYSEKLLATKTAELYKMEPEEKQAYLQKAETRIRAASIYIQVGPAKSLSTNGALKWVLKQISLE
ncbi:uncharacterized protein LOC141626268 isoform X2 [Silene latifolia]|uniref:uncharacterized protein LOC141626268 isoform X2 n=1 Tax=Silene latifolia TaxID=37657 RepID=UPI003D78798F